VSLRLYLNHHVRIEITDGIRRRGVDLLTAYEDNRHEADDPALLDRASHLERVLFSQDRDLLVEVSRRQKANQRFCGVIYAHQLAITIGQCIDDLELICGACELSELENRLIYLPL
jgi:hypothetical protein